MADDVRYAVVIEPPVSAANGLLEAMRRLAGDVGARLPGVQWASPEHYLAPVAFVSGAALPDSAAEGLRRAAREVEELGLQAGFPRLVAEGEGAGVIAAPVTSKGDELDVAVQAVVRCLRDVGLDVEVAGRVEVPLAYVAGAEALERVGTSLGAPRDAPLAGWLAGGLWVAEGPAAAEGRPWRGVRVRFVAMKRLAARRPSPSPRPVEPAPTTEPAPEAAEPAPVENGNVEE